MARFSQSENVISGIYIETQDKILKFPKVIFMNRGFLAFFKKGKKLIKGHNSLCSKKEEKIAM